FQSGVGGTREFAGARTDPEGFFTARVPAGAYGVAASHPAYASAEATPVEVSDSNETPALQIAMLPPRHLIGRLLLPGVKTCVRVRLLNRSGATVHAENLCDAEGRYRLRVASPQGTLNILPPRGLMLAGVQDIPVNLKEAMQADLGDIRFKALPHNQGTV